MSDPLVPATTIFPLGRTAWLNACEIVSLSAVSKSSSAVPSLPNDGSGPPSAPHAGTALTPAAAATPTATNPTSVDRHALPNTVSLLRSGRLPSVGQPIQARDAPRNRRAAGRDPGDVAPGEAKLTHRHVLSGPLQPASRGVSREHTGRDDRCGFTGRGRAPAVDRGDRNRPDQQAAEQLGIDPRPDLAALHGAG